MRKGTITVIALIGCVVGIWSANAGAAGSESLCPGAETAIPSGTYQNLTVTGNEAVEDGATVTVTGNLAVAPGACLDAFSLGSVNVGRNITVGKGAILALGCAPDASGGSECTCPSGVTSGPTCTITTDTNDVVGGNIIANGALTMYLTADTVDGNVISTQGGPGVTLSPYVNFPIKDMTIKGNLIVQGWQGAWFGALRNHVSGNVIVQNVTGATDGGEFGYDSNEVNTNTVGGNLICQGNSPTIQFGDSGGAPNEVAGNAIGQCAFNVTLPDENYPPGTPEPISVKS